MTRKETDRKNPSRNSKFWMLGLLGLVLPLTFSAQPAAADLRVRAELRTPHVSVRLDNHEGRVIRRKPMLRANLYSSCTLHLSKQDRRIARRMSHMTGIREYRLLNLRRSGFSWNEIGWDIGLSRRELRWALNGKPGNGHGYAYGHGQKRGHRGR